MNERSKIMKPIKSDPVKTGVYITNLRKKRDMTQLSLATALQVSHQAVSKWETGSALPDIDILLAIANLFEVSIENLLAGGDEENYSLADDRMLYSETITNIIKTKHDISLLLEAYDEMLEEDITDCIQTLGISDPDIFLKLCTRLSSGKIAQIIETLRLSSVLPLISDKMSRADITDCIQTLGIRDAEVIRSICK